MFSSKKAMSPLIATILLIAFAVALGAMIMNWSVDVAPAVEGDDVTAGMCDGIAIRIGDNFCYRDNTLKLDVKNIGNQRIDSIKYVTKTDISETASYVKNSGIDQNSNFETEVPFLYTSGNIEIEFVPQLILEGNLVDCSANAARVSALPSCLT